MTASWRAMTVADIPVVNAIADRVHVDYPEDEAVLAERQRLYPAGCLILEMDGEPMGYALTHPWHYLQPPALNVALGALPDAPSTYYIHDVAMLPEARGARAGSAAVRAIVDHATASGMSNVSLVAIKGSEGFWSRHGFETVSDPQLDKKLKSYDEAARYMVRRL
ncbi:MAG: GNAT family N-acetyltransferase [Hyphomicrobium sp.]